MTGELVTWTRQSSWCCSYSFYQGEITFDKTEFCILLLLFLENQPTSQASQPSTAVIQSRRGPLNEFLLRGPPSSQQLSTPNTKVIPLHQNSLCQSTHLLMELMSHRTPCVSSLPSSHRRSFRPTCDLETPSADLLLSTVTAAELPTLSSDPQEHYEDKVVRRRSKEDMQTSSCCGSSCRLSCYKLIFW